FLARLGMGCKLLWNRLLHLCLYFLWRTREGASLGTLPCGRNTGFTALAPWAPGRPVAQALLFILSPKSRHRENSTTSGSRSRYPKAHRRDESDVRLIRPRASFAAFPQFFFI